MNGETRKCRRGCHPISDSDALFLQSCIDTLTLDTAALAERLGVSKRTIRRKFDRICKRLEVHSRAAAALKGQFLRLVGLPDNQTAEAVILDVIAPYKAGAI